MALQQALARRLGLPATPVMPGQTFGEVIDPLSGIDPRLKRLKLLPQPVSRGIAGIRLPNGL